MPAPRTFPSRTRLPCWRLETTRTRGIGLPVDDRGFDGHAAAIRCVMALTFDEALEHLGRVPDSDYPVLLEGLRRVGDLMRTGGRPHATELAAFLVEFVKRSVVSEGKALNAVPVFPRPDNTPSGTFRSFPDLLRQAAAAPGLLEAHTLIRRHRDLLPNQPVEAALKVFGKEGIDSVGNAYVVAALGLLAEDGPSQVLARLAWSEHLLRSGWPQRALHHATRAVSLQYAVGDSTTLVAAHAQLANVFGKTGDLAGRADALRRALAAFDQDDEVPPEEKLSFQRGWLDALMGLRRFHEVMPVLDTAEELANTIGPGSGTAYLPAFVILLHRTQVAEHIGALRAAIQTYRRILDGRELPHHNVPRSWVTTRLASCLARSGRRREAIRLLMREVEAAEQKGTDWLSVPERCALAWLLLDQDPDADVDHHLARCLFDVDRTGWAGIGQVFIIMGDLERRDGHITGAAECYRYALYLAPGPDHPEQPDKLPNRAERVLTSPLLRSLQMPVNETHSHFIAGLRETLDLGRSPGPDLPELRVMARERLFHVTPDHGERWELAEELGAGMSHAFQQDEATTLRDLAIPVAEVFREVYGSVSAVRFLTDVLNHHEKHGRLAEPRLAVALTELLNETPGGHQRAFDVLWHHRELRLRNRALSPIHQDADDAAGQAQPIYEELLSLLTLHGQTLRLPDHRPAPVLAFDLHEEAKAQGIVQDLSRMPLQRPHAMPSDLFTAEDELLAEQRRLAAGDRPDRAARWREHAAQLAGIHDALDEAAPAYARMRRAAGARFDDVLRLIEEGAPAEGMVFASYFVGESQTFCFVLASGCPEPTLYRIPWGRAKLHAAAEDIRRTVDGDRSVFPPVPPIKPRRPARLPLEGLADQLLPFQELLEGRQLLCVAPHGPLSVLPLGALRLRDGRYCTEHAAVVYVPSISAIEYLRAARPVRSGAALCVRVAGSEDLQRGRAGFETHALPGAPGWEVTSLTGLKATPEQVFAGLGRAGLAYIACHGYRDLNDPENSALMLSDGAERPSRSLEGTSRQAIRKFLRARDLPKGGTAMPARVVLRACSAGWHEPEHPGEDFTGLPRALLREGTRTVLAPIWQVDQDSSAELLDHFTAGVMNGVPVWRALWNAQRRMLADETRAHLAHPYHWAAFVPLGDWS
ncbi:CHAT domain-containing protein [Streptomyces sp. NPDC046984]|uniref:CHAT domain-containing protein n=1 Tax=Streptomyces sp. NPDC046984 TaxID=3155138 RepID=UPI0033E02317